MPKTSDRALALMSLDEMAKARAFHGSFPMYGESPLVSLEFMAKYLGLGGLYIKDESHRFGLNAFKVLGASFAMGKFIAKKIGKDISELPFDALISDAVKDSTGDITFYTATDGNHGRGVAWAADKLHQKAVVYMPDGTSGIRRDNICREGADCNIISGKNYDDCVKLAAYKAQQNPNGVIVQDTAWAGYEEIPTWIMQGYGTMAFEAKEQLREPGVSHPTHVFIQTGNGSLAGALTACFKNLYPANPPVITVVESCAAHCHYLSAISGRIETVGGEMKTIMAGLACGEPNTISWEILKNHAAFFASCPDFVAAKGMRMLAAPLGTDRRIISGESGAVAFGLLACLMMSDDMKDFRTDIGLDSNSKVMLFSTEGDTDPENYKSIVWNGECPSCI
jgi:diaminopropionate ammonia-lyase